MNRINLPNNNCTYCYSCLLSCPKKCISFESGLFGTMPIIDETKCIQCGNCIKHCHVLNPQNRQYPIKCFASWSKKNAAKNSASGGIFYEIASTILLDGGIVYGVGCEANKAKFMKITKEEDLFLLQGSKYVYSVPFDIFKEVERDLKDGKLVLFSGLPCQIGAIKAFLQKEYCNLLLIELICHGAPMPILFEKYIKYYELINKCEVLNWKFREHLKVHKNGYYGSVSLKKKQNKKRKIILWNTDPYYYHFMKSNICRDVCLNCSYASADRGADITLGDFWGIEKIDPKLKTGFVSIVLINSIKGLSQYNLVADNIISKETDVSLSCSLNPQLNKPTVSNTADRKKFESNFNKNGWEEVSKSFFKENKKYILYAWLVFILPDFIKKFFNFPKMIFKKVQK